MIVRGKPSKKETKSKLDARAKKCMFVGYLEGVKEFKLYFEECGSSKCSISRDVVFRESKYYLAKETQVRFEEDSMGQDHGRE